MFFGARLASVVTASTPRTDNLEFESPQGCKGVIVELYLLQYCSLKLKMHGKKGRKKCF
jgi:hypothetical protein